MYYFARTLPPMDFFETVKRRRSVRKYNGMPVPDDVVSKALDAALLAPNSSNLQTWQFFWIKNPDTKAKLVLACLDQNAAKSSEHLVAIVADPSLWKKHQIALLAHLRAQNSPPVVFSYYEKLIPALYGWRLLAPLKWLVFNLIGFFKPMSRRPWSSRDLAEISIKSAALASQNFMLAIAAQGFDTCPMEGFDEARVKRILNLSRRARVVMMISVGMRNPKGLWGDQFRFPKEQSVYVV